eukprot:1869684-Amphidinium_carterae.1
MVLKQRNPLCVFSHAASVLHVIACGVRSLAKVVSVLTECHVPVEVLVLSVDVVLVAYVVVALGVDCTVLVPSFVGVVLGDVLES